jgi:hypothetical protein
VKRPGTREQNGDVIKNFCAAQYFVLDPGWTSAYMLHCAVQQSR